MAGGRPATPRSRRAAPSRLDVAENAAEVRVALPAAVLFEAARADVQPRAATLLSEAAAIVRRCASADVRIEGYGEPWGSEVASRRLGERRANAVAQWLTVREGLRDVRMVIRGIGGTVPASAAGLRAGQRERQRGRVEIVLSRIDESAARRAGRTAGDAESHGGG